jgi:predicted DNA-binding transcriptional regulator AlpA
MRIPDSEKLLYVSDILAILKKANVVVSRQTFYKWVKEKTFPESTYRFGLKKVWTMTQFKEWLQNCVEKAQFA